MIPPAVDDEAGTMTMTSRANPVAEPKGDEDTDDVRGGGTPVDEDGGGGMLPDDTHSHPTPQQKIFSRHMDGAVYDNSAGAAELQVVVLGFYSGWSMIHLTAQDVGYASCGKRIYNYLDEQ